MSTPNPATLASAARDLRGQVAAIDRALAVYRRGHEQLRREGPGRQHLDAYHKPALRRLTELRRHLAAAAGRLERAAEDLDRRLRELRTDQRNVMDAMPGYLRKKGYPPSEIGDYRRNLPETGDPAWASLAREVVGRSATRHG